MKQNRRNVAVLFGGQSAEHEVSLQSAKNVIEAMDKEKYRPVLIGIDKSGQWHWVEEADFLINADDPRHIALNLEATAPVAVEPRSRGRLSVPSRGWDGPVIDVAFPVLHGPFGEDGTVQGLLKLAGIPFVGAGVLGSAVGMDKDVTKRLLRDAGIPIADFRVFRAGQPTPDFNEMANLLGSPLFVKPANLGSSVGVSQADSQAQFRQAVQTAFEYDTKVVVEAFVKGREIECSVLGNQEPMASVPGEIIPTHGFYSYEAKYIDENGASLEIPAKIPEETARRVRDLGVKTYQALCCEGLARVDFFLRPDGKILVNEINTIPGFTAISMYPRLWEASGISYTQLIDRLIALALERFEGEKQLKSVYT